METPDIFTIFSIDSSVDTYYDLADRAAYEKGIVPLKHRGMSIVKTSVGKQTASHGFFNVPEGLSG